MLDRTFDPLHAPPHPRPPLHAPTHPRPPILHAPPHSRLPIAAGVVDVWRANLDVVGEEATELLTPAERWRGARIVSERRRVRWMRSRGLLRALLGAYLQVDPRTLRLTRGPHGKPALAGEHVPAHLERGLPLSFNHSHSGGVALYAVTAGDAIGVDLEVHRERRLDEPALALRLFGAAASRRLLALEDPAERRRAFLRLWVRHEAVLKCRGGDPACWAGDLVCRGDDLCKGGRGWGSACKIDGHGGGDPAGSHAPARVRAEGVGSPLWISELCLGSQAVAAVAGEGGLRELRLLELPSCGPPRQLSAALRGHHGGPQAASSQPQPAV